MQHSQIFVRIALAAAVLGSAALPGRAQSTTPVFGAISISFGETLRVNVVNLVDPATPPDPCKLQVNFANATGQTVKTANITVNNGQTGWANINFLEASQSPASSNTDSALRQVLHPVIGAVPASCRVAITSEVYETVSGRSSLYIPPVFLPAVQSNTVGQ